MERTPVRTCTRNGYPPKRHTVLWSLPDEKLYILVAHYSYTRWNMTFNCKYVYECVMILILTPKLQQMWTVCVDDNFIDVCDGSDVIALIKYHR